MLGLIRSRLTPRAPVRRALFRLAALTLVVTTAAGCAAGRAASRGTSAAQANEWDVAVDQFRKALQLDPDNTEYRIALTRAMQQASLHYAEQGRIAELRGQTDVALTNYRRANDFDPSNRQLAAKVTSLERTLRAQAEARPQQPTVEQLRAAAARQGGPPALVGLNEVLPAFQYINQPVRTIIEAIATAAGINVQFERTFENSPQRTATATVQMDGATLEQALNAVMTGNQLFYKVLTANTILVIPENQANRQLYEEQIIKVLRLSNADATEVVGMIQQVVRMPGSNQNQFSVSANKTQNTITMRAPVNVAAVIERVVAMTDKPRAEVVVDVEILEVNRRRVKQYGLDLGDYAIGAVFSPETTAIANGALTPQPFNLDTVASGIAQNDFYLAVPSATIRFLESDSETKLLAKPQLRGSEGEKLRLELGEEIPIPTTVYTPIASGGANVNPLSSFTYRPVGVVLEITPRVTYDENVIIEMTVENSARTGDTTIAGTTAPTFSTRRVAAKLRLRDGESNLLAGLVQQGDRRSLRGFPGILRLPVIKQLFSANDNTIEQSDVVVLLTPRIVRTHELNQQDFDPLYIGTPTNLGVGGPAPLIVQPLLANAPAAATPPNPAGANVPPPAAPALAPAAGAAGANVPPAAATLPTPPRDVAAAPAPVTTGESGGLPGQIRLMPQSTEVRVGNGALAVPIAVTGSRLSSATLTITYNPAVLRVAAVQQSSFLASSGGPVAFTEDHANPGRIDIVMLRTNDKTGATGAGTLAALLFDAIAPGTANLSVTGTATAPGGAPNPMQFVPTPAVVVK